MAVAFSPPVNAFCEAMWLELRTTFDSISRDGDIRAVVLGSNLPKVWTAGLDRKTGTFGYSGYFGLPFGMDISDRGSRA
ncbi:hypothetical protein FRB93_008664 [Tulasnella sp. JGI-2019a]|nr:hypothetical protein FRB93_008664 [Tulasnella sp. JGI-2019a]